MTAAEFAEYVEGEIETAMFYAMALADDCSKLWCRAVWRGPSGPIRREQLRIILGMAAVN